MKSNSALIRGALLIGMLVIVTPTTTHAEDAPRYIEEKKKKDCSSPEGLSPELRKAYEQLKELEKQLDGMKVEVVCKNERRNR